MLKYRCLILDHDDTVVQSEKTINYPCFCQFMSKLRPDIKITLEEYIRGCYFPGFVKMCRQWYHFTERELVDEYQYWQEYMKNHLPDPYPGIENVIHRQKEEGGLICVVSHSHSQYIARDYQKRFGILPDDIYGSDLPEEYCKPSIYPIEHIRAKYDLKKEDILVVDDLKPAWEMARNAGTAIAFAAWSKQQVPQILQEMTKLCNYRFDSPAQLEAFLFHQI